MEEACVEVIGLCGSLRARSYNLMALRAAQRLAPSDMRLTIASIRGIPLYDDDLRRAGEPEAVTELKHRIAQADAVLIVSPEYNHSVPGVLKNTLDWLSRPPLLPFDGKPVAIMGASTGLLGTARGQYHLRQVLQYLNTFTVNKPEVFIGQAERKFDEGGELTDEMARKLIGDLLARLQGLTERLAPPHAVPA
jgi:chromate reductase